MILHERLKAVSSSDSIHQLYRPGQLVSALFAHRHVKQQSQLVPANKQLPVPPDEVPDHMEKWLLRHTKKLTARYQTVDLWKMKHGSQKEEALVMPSKKNRAATNNVADIVISGTPKNIQQDIQLPERASLKLKQQSMTLTRLPKLARPIIKHPENEEQPSEEADYCLINEL